MTRCIRALFLLLILPCVLFAEEPQVLIQKSSNLERAKEILESAPKESAKEPTSIAIQGAGMMKALSLTLALFFIGVFVYKKFSKHSPSIVSQGKIINRVFLSPKASVYHIEVSGKEIFVTVSDTGVSMLHAHNQKKEFDA